MDTPNLVLTGFMGTGKTSVGRIVAERLGRPFVDMDAMIEERAGKSVARIFAEQGEATFRRMEAELCEALGRQQGLVIATGGGALVDPVNRATLARSSTLICLNAPVDEILDRVGEAGDRPLLSGANPRADAARLLSARRDAYAAIPWQVDTMGRGASELADQVVRLATVRTLRVPHLSGQYDVHVGDGILELLGGRVRAAGILEQALVAVVSNTAVAPLYAEAVVESLEQRGYGTFVVEIPDGEAYKTLETVHALYDAFLHHDLDRDGVVLALGGGVVGDIAGFAAATYMRGVRFIQVPTTLLAMTDASVGGKTGVDLPQGKNLVGAFKQPELAFIDLAVLGTLPEAELRSGLAEVIKHGVIADPDLFEDLAAALDSDALAITTDLLARSIAVKIDIVKQDPHERGLRAVLNLGHTVGHALEWLSGYEMRHGEAVAIGMVAAARIAEGLGRARPGLGDRLSTILGSAGLTANCPARPAREIWNAMRHDKKRHGQRLRWILPVRVGEVQIAENVPEELVLSTLIEMGAKT
ncbi:MAG: 3-dehydroquinate synthase [Anaerolineae bacterium]